VSPQVAPWRINLAFICFSVTLDFSPRFAGIRNDKNGTAECSAGAKVCIYGYGKKNNVLTILGQKTFSGHNRFKTCYFYSYKSSKTFV
jgi:hypothetical protein